MYVRFKFLYYSELRIQNWYLQTGSLRTKKMKLEMTREFCFRSDYNLWTLNFNSFFRFSLQLLTGIKF